MPAEDLYQEGWAQALEDAQRRAVALTTFVFLWGRHGMRMAIRSELRRKRGVRYGRNRFEPDEQWEPKDLRSRDEVDKREARITLRWMVKRVRLRMTTAIVARALAGDDETDSELARRLGVSRQRVGQCKQEAIMKFREKMR